MYTPTAELALSRGYIHDKFITPQNVFATSQNNCTSQSQTLFRHFINTKITLCRFGGGRNKHFIDCVNSYNGAARSHIIGGPIRGRGPVPDLQLFCPQLDEPLLRDNVTRENSQILVLLYFQPVGVNVDGLIGTNVARCGLALRRHREQQSANWAGENYSYHNCKGRGHDLASPLRQNAHFHIT